MESENETITSRKQKPAQSVMTTKHFCKEKPKYSKKPRVTLT